MCHNIFHGQTNSCLINSKSALNLNIPNPEPVWAKCLWYWILFRHQPLPLTRLSVEKLKSNKKLLLVFAALLLPSLLAPVDFFVTRELNITNLVTANITEDRKCFPENFFGDNLLSLSRIRRGEATHYYSHQRGWKTRTRNPDLINKISSKIIMMKNKARKVLLRILPLSPRALRISFGGCSDWRSPRPRECWESDKSRNSWWP